MPADERMTDEEMETFMSGFHEACNPLIEWLSVKGRKTLRVYVMHFGAELIDAVGHYIPNENESTLN